MLASLSPPPSLPPGPVPKPGLGLQPWVSLIISILVFIKRLLQFLSGRRREDAGALGGTRDVDGGTRATGRQRYLGADLQRRAQFQPHGVQQMFFSEQQQSLAINALLLEHLGGTPASS